jgi:hypothetical protein
MNYCCFVILRFYPHAVEEECGKPASVKMYGRWFCEGCADFLIEEESKGDDEEEENVT